MADLNKKEDQEFENLKILCKRIGYGEMKITVQNGKPVRMDVGIKQIKLDMPQNFTDGLDTIPL